MATRNDPVPKIGVTMGDPAGVGPELCCRLLANASSDRSYTPIIFGDATVMHRVAAQLQLPPPEHITRDPNELTDANDPTVFDLGLLGDDDFEAGSISAATGQASFAYIEHAIQAAKDNLIDGVTTGPIHKQAWDLANVPFPGHTELFADRFGTNKFCMMMTSPAFSCSLVTTHVGYHEVPKLLTADRILEVMQLTHHALGKILNRVPKLAVLGLNPHAGEGGLFGNREEEVLIQPAVDRAREAGVQLGPVMPPDTAFLPRNREQYDGFICMYHDQGLIPFKALNFDTGVNITLGLPKVRTSVDHGTALDIAWQGKADASSLLSAVKLAARLAK